MDIQKEMYHGFVAFYKQHGQENSLGIQVKVDKLNWKCLTLCEITHCFADKFCDFLCIHIEKESPKRARVYTVQDQNNKNAM